MIDYRKFRSVSLLTALVFFLSAQAQAQNGTFTDLRLKKPGTAAGVYTFRTDNDGSLKSFNDSGVETGSWDAATGTFTGTYAGTVPAENITAGTLASNVVVQDGSLSTNVPRKSDTAAQVFAGSLSAPALRTTVTGAGFTGQILFGETGAGTITLITSPFPRFVFNLPIAGDGSLLSALNASNLGSGTVPNARLDSDLTALGNNATNGLWARTGTGTGAARTITGSGNDITVTNGNGVSGNPVISAGSNLAKFNSANLNFTAGMLTLNHQYANSGVHGIRVYDVIQVDEYDWVFNGGQNYWQTNKGAGIYAAGGFFGSGAGLTGVGKTGSANTWTGANTFSGVLNVLGFRGNTHITSAGTNNIPVTCTFIVLNPSLGNQTLVLPPAASVGHEIWASVINRDTSNTNTITWDSGAGNVVHGPGVYSQTWTLTGAQSNASHRWFKIIKMSPTTWSIDSGVFQ